MNRESYNAIAAQWDAARTCFYGRERAYVDALLEGLSLPSDVLDLGCGTGRPIAEYILSRGHRVTGVDQADALLNLARARFPDATWINRSIETFVPARKYHAIVCWDALFHMERSLHESVFERIAAMLLPAGKLMLTCGGSDQSATDGMHGFTDSMFGKTFFYDSYPPAIVLSILGRLGFTSIISEYMNLPTTARDKGRYAIVAAMSLDLAP